MEIKKRKVKNYAKDARELKAGELKPLPESVTE